MTFNLFEAVQIFTHPEPEPAPALEIVPQPPQTLDDLLGVGIAFTHTNRFLYPDIYIGTVTDYRYCESKSNPTGWLEVKVKSPTFNLEKWVHEDNFVCYAWELPKAATVAVTAS